MFVSTKATGAAILADCPSPQAKLLLILLAATVDGKLQCFPSLGTLCARSGIKSERTVQAHLQALADAQPPLLRIESDEAPNGRRTSNVYTVLLPVEGATPAAPMERPRRRHPNAFKRRQGVVDKSVGKPVTKGADTPQNLRGHPAKSAGTYPAKSAGLEPLPINKNTRETTEAAKTSTTGPNGPDGRPLKGRRYVVPGGAPVKAAGLGEEERVAKGLGELAERLRGSKASTMVRR